jgi:hypothetical protein
LHQRTIDHALRGLDHPVDDVLDVLSRLIVRVAIDFFLEVTHEPRHRHFHEAWTAFRRGVDSTLPSALFSTKLPQVFDDAGVPSIPQDFDDRQEVIGIVGDDAFHVF